MSHSSIPHELNLSPDVVRVPLGHETFALIDTADAATVVQWRWRRLVTPNGVYANGQHQIDGVREDTYLHILLMQPPPGMTVDHANGNTLDCRRENLRIATRQEQARNRRKRRGSKYPYKGIYQVEGSSRWYAKLFADGKNVYLGGHDTPEEAARAYDQGAREYFGEFARLNFPDAESEAA
jgi:hypothetical protein